MLNSIQNILSSFISKKSKRLKYTISEALYVFFLYLEGVWEKDNEEQMWTQEREREKREVTGRWRK
jgi:hypothetical protein